MPKLKIPPLVLVITFIAVVNLLAFWAKHDGSMWAKLIMLPVIAVFLMVLFVFGF